MKIKITNKEKNIIGTYKKKVIVPYGNSARIPERKSNIAKNVYVIYPKKAKYSWVFSKNELESLLKTATQNLKDFDTKHLKVYENAINSIDSDKFNLNDMKFVLDLVKNERSLLKLIQKINNVYLKK